MKFEASGGFRKPTDKSMRELYARFMKDGNSGRHSSLGTTLAPLLNRLTQEGVAFRLTYVPNGGGYFLEKHDDLS